MYNEKYVDKYLIKPAEDGTRADTKLAVEYSDDAVAELLADGYVLVGDDDFQKLIGNADKPYSIAMDGTLYETPPHVPSLEEVQEQKIAEFKAKRDEEEIAPINNFDADEKAIMRMNNAIIILDATKEIITWTLADNSTIEVSADDLRDVIIHIGARSSELHEKYRILKEKIEACTTEEELAAVKWEE